MTRTVHAPSLRATNGDTHTVEARLRSARVHVTVVGDIMLDGWWQGHSDRLCREAPAPVVEVERCTYAPGGAANTAMNLAALGAEVTLVGVIGDDEHGDHVRQLLGEGGVDTSGVVVRPGATTTKFRVLSGDQIALRLDRTAPPAMGEVAAEVAQHVERTLERTDAVIVCDYGAGAADARLIDVIGAHRRGRLVVVDAHDPARWSQLAPDIATPNAQEAARLVGADLADDPERAVAFAARSSMLMARTGAQAVVVTLDRDGSLLLDAAGAHRTWGKPVTERQASGGGDTYVAALAVCRAAGLPLTLCSDVAQTAADIVVARPGTAVCALDELAAALRGEVAPIDEAALRRTLDAARASGRTVVMTNGWFDALHHGHTHLLREARALGDILVVAVNAGPQRECSATAAERAAVVGALSCVDHVIVFEDATAERLVEELRPDVYVKGTDERTPAPPESSTVRRYGGAVHLLDHAAGTP